MRLFKLTKSNWQLAQLDNGFRLTIDSVLLANFPNLKGVKYILELGAGNGAISLMLLMRKNDLDITAIEYDDDAYTCLLKSIEINNITRIHPVHSDFRDISLKWFNNKGFDMVIANPPFFKMGTHKKSKNKNKRCSRFEEFGTFNDYAKKAYELLKQKGRFVFVHRNERLQEIMNILKENRLYMKKIRFVHSYINKESEIFLVDTIKDGAFGVKVLPPLVVYKEKNIYTNEVLGFY